MVRTCVEEGVDLAAVVDAATAVQPFQACVSLGVWASKKEGSNFWPPLSDSFWPAILTSNSIASLDLIDDLWELTGLPISSASWAQTFDFTLSESVQFVLKHNLDVSIPLGNMVESLLLLFGLNWLFEIFIQNLINFSLGFENRWEWKSNKTLVPCLELTWLKKSISTPTTVWDFEGLVAKWVEVCAPYEIPFTMHKASHTSSVLISSWTYPILGFFSFTAFFLQFTGFFTKFNWKSQLNSKSFADPKSSYPTNVDIYFTRAEIRRRRSSISHKKNTWHFCWDLSQKMWFCLFNSFPRGQ